MKRVSLKEAPSHMELTDWRFRNINRINHDHSLITSVVLITTTARQMTSAVNLKDQGSIGTSFQRTREKATEVWTRDLYDFKCLWHGIEDMESRSNFVICFFFFFSVWWSRQCLYWCRYMFNGTLLMMWWSVRDWRLTKGPCDPSKSYMCVTF